MCASAVSTCATLTAEIPAWTDRQLLDVLLHVDLLEFRSGQLILIIYLIQNAAGWTAEYQVKQKIVVGFQSLGLGVR